jgi:hypothetical protein
MVRKAAYECFVECATILQDKFWAGTRRFINEHQAKMIQHLMKSNDARVEAA